MSELLDDVERALETDPDLVVVLERNRGWMSLLGHIEARRVVRERQLVHAILSTDAPVDQRKIDYQRGYLDAIAWMTTLPERMRRKLKEEGENAQ